MPSKRRPKDHASTGGARLTEATVRAYKAYTEELIANGYTVKAGDLLHPVQAALGHEPWGDILPQAVQAMLQPDPALDREAFEDCLEEIHKQAFPEAHGRPPRLTGAPIPDPRVSDPRE